MKGGAILCVILVLAWTGDLTMVIKPTEALTCLEVDPNLAGCIGYLTGIDSRPLAACCNGVKRVRGMSITTADKRLACNCIKSAATRIPGIKDTAVFSLSDACNIPLPFPISASFDCNSID